MDQTDWLFVAFAAACAVAFTCACVYDERRRQRIALTLDAILSQRARLEAETRAIEVVRRQQHEELIALEHKRLDIARRMRDLDDSAAAASFGLPTQPPPRPASLSQPMGTFPPLGPASPSRPLSYCPDCWQLLRMRYPGGYAMEPQGEVKFCHDHLIGRIREQDLYDFSWQHVSGSVPVVPVVSAGDEPMRELSQQSGVTMLNSIEQWLRAQQPGPEQQQEKEKEKEGKGDDHQD